MVAAEAFVLIVVEVVAKLHEAKGVEGVK